MVRSLLVPIASLLALLALAGACSDPGFSAEDQATPASPTPATTGVRLVITRDYGATVLRSALVEVDENTDVMRVLTENTEVESEGGFVSAIEGLEATESAAWFYSVDGLLADVGAADYALRGGETVWWDHHRWDGAMFAGTAVHAFPVPWAGRPLPVASGEEVVGLEDWADEHGLEFGVRRDLSEGRPDDGLVACTAAEAAATPWLVDLLSDEGGAAPVAVDGGALTALDMDGAPAASVTAAVLALPNDSDPERPLLLVLLADAAAAGAAFDVLTPAALRGRLAVAVVEGASVSLPLEAAP